jgi:hypothetical protein
MSLLAGRRWRSFHGTATTPPGAQELQAQSSRCRLLGGERDLQGGLGEVGWQHTHDHGEVLSPPCSATQAASGVRCNSASPSQVCHPEPHVEHPLRVRPLRLDRKRHQRGPSIEHWGRRGATPGNVNPNWLHRGGGKWPHLGLPARPELGQGGLVALGLSPEDAGGVSIDFGEEVFDSL